MRFLDAATVAALGPGAAIRAITAALDAGFDPATDPARLAVHLEHGHFLLMPSETGTGTGVKIATVAPGNPARGHPRIQATYLLFDRETLALRAALDGTALTTLRTPAVSVAAVVRVLPDRPLHLVVLGAGPQAHGHVAALGAVRPLSDTTFLVRNPSRGPKDSLRLGTPEADAALRGADVVVCATSAVTPLFDSELIRADGVVLAVGSHEPHVRELDAHLFGRSTVIVEDVGAATREAGDVVMAIAEGTIGPDDLVPMNDVVTGAFTPPTDRPVLFKGVGMSWQDLVVAEAVLAQAG